jgi:hypothetical protein
MGRMMFSTTSGVIGLESKKNTMKEIRYSENNV